mmetsp:Transcript_27371/g.82544  ORF Transcript_27371/g.82544 Transcript_27371/m.82544 type:complete len:220 (+) Transcript_27371:504-1163(+)
MYSGVASARASGWSHMKALPKSQSLARQVRSSSPSEASSKMLSGFRSEWTTFWSAKSWIAWNSCRSKRLSTRGSRFIASKKGKWCTRYTRSRGWKDPRATNSPLMSNRDLDSGEPPYSMTTKMSLRVSSTSNSLVMCRIPGKALGASRGAPPGPNSRSPTAISLCADLTSDSCFCPVPLATCFTATLPPCCSEVASQTAPHAPRPSNCFFTYSAGKRPP